MSDPTPLQRLTIGKVMVVIAFLAIGFAAFAASYRDRERPDFMLVPWCVLAAFMAASGDSRMKGRDLAEAWGNYLALLGVFLAGEIWLSVVFTPLPPGSSVLQLMVWNYWPALAAFPAGILGRFLARKRYDRLHPVPIGQEETLRPSS